MTTGTDTLPARALGHRPPLVAYPEAVCTGRPYRPEREEELLDLGRVDQSLAQGRWFRRTTDHGTFTLGSQRYVDGPEFGLQTVEITFDPVQRVFCCRPEGSAETLMRAAVGLTKADLMGELASLLARPAYQLALPLSPEGWRQLELTRCLTGTAC